MKHIPSQLSVAYVLSQFPAYSETFIIEELLELKRRDIKLVVFSLKTPKKDEPISEYTTGLTSQVYYSAFYLSWPVLVANLRLVLRRPLLYFSLIWILFSSLISQPIELLKSLAVVPKTVYFAEVAYLHKCTRIHAHFCNVPTMAARMISMILGVPFSCTAHGSDIFQYPPVDLVKRVREAAPFITISEYNRQYLAALSDTLEEGMIEVIHCGVNLDKFTSLSRHLVVGQTLRILTVARLEHVKGLDILVNACALLRDTGLDFTCDLVGDGSERATLEKLVRTLNLQKQVHFWGAVPHEDVIRYYQEADLFVLPSRREGIPVSVMEAMATELPVVATRVTGLPEIIDNGRTGTLVPPENGRLLADAIVRLTKKSDILGEMGLRGREKIEVEFNIELSVERLLALWSSENNNYG